MLISSTYLLALAVLQSEAQEFQTRHWLCPGEEYARNAIETGDAASWPNYSEGPGMRVQRQHPQTGLWALAKYIAWSDQQIGICQYYNSVGHVATMLVPVEGRGLPGEDFQWRMEWSETDPGSDREGREMLETCVENRDGSQWPGVGCAFIIRVIPNED